jgi:hypothetical protein
MKNKAKEQNDGEELYLCVMLSRFLPVFTGNPYHMREFISLSFQTVQ